MTCIYKVALGNDTLFPFLPYLSYFRGEIWEIYGNQMSCLVLVASERARETLLKICHWRIQDFSEILISYTM